jgi:HEAT repeat protein
MPRRRSIKIVCLTAVVLACGVAGYLAVNRRTPEASFQGCSASYWLGAVFGVKGQQRQALDAFRQMGTNAAPVLVAAIAARENLPVRTFRRIYPRLPAMIRQRFPQPANLEELRSAALFIARNTPSVRLAPKLLPLLKTPDSDLRWAVLVASRIGPSDAGEISWLLLAENDPDIKVRAGMLQCLSWIGPSATNAVPAVLKLCQDNDMSVRTDAAWALWKITGQTNAAVPVLEEVLRALDQNHVVQSPHWVACDLLEMGKSGSSLVPVFINSLTNSHVSTGARMSACSCLGQIGPPAAAAIPALRLALLDPDPEVRQRAESALTRIDPEHAAPNSP